MSIALTPWISDAAEIERDLIDEIESAITNHPRSLQSAIGPSEIGIGCTRRLLHKLHGDRDPPRPGGVPWLPTIGTAVHSWLAYVMSHAIGQDLAEPRYMIERRVMVGTIGGVDIHGSSDLFDWLTGTVIDWKIIGKTPMDDYRRHGPRPEYRVQAHLYGRGFALAGYQVNRVMIACLPRNEPSLAQRFFWSEPYDETIALAALDRANGLLDLITALGIERAVALYPPCADTRNCPYCYEPPVIRPADPAADPFGASRKVYPR